MERGRRRGKMRQRISEEEARDEVDGVREEQD